MTPNRRNYVILLTAMIVAAGLVIGVISKGRPGTAVAGRAEKVGNTSMVLKDSGAVDDGKQGRPSAHGKGGPAILSLNDLPRLSRDEMTPEEARMLLERVRAEVKDVRHRATLSAAILSGLCRQGYGDEAWRLLDAGQGLVRVGGIAAIFGSDSLPVNDLISKLQGLNSVKDRAEGLRALIAGRPAGVLGLDFSAIRVESAEEKDAIARGLSQAIHRASEEKNPEVAGKLVEKSIALFNEGKVETIGLAKILNYSGAGDPFRQWDLLKSAKVAEDSKDAWRVHASLVQEMVSADLDRGMKLLVSTPATKQSPKVIQFAMEVIYGMDPAKANAWVTGQLPTLEPATGQRVVASVAEVSLAGGEYETARQWAARMTDEKARDELIQKINTAQYPSPLIGQ